MGNVLTNLNLWFAAVTELIRFTVSGNPYELSAHMPLVVVLVPQVMALRPRFAATVKVSTKYVSYLYIIFCLCMVNYVLLVSASFSHSLYGLISDIIFWSFLIP
jgi:transportin-3